jgi:hypothetical protein
MAYGIVALVQAVSNDVVTALARSFSDGNTNTSRVRPLGS